MILRAQMYGTLVFRHALLTMENRPRPNSWEPGVAVHSAVGLRSKMESTRSLQPVRIMVSH